MIKMTKPADLSVVDTLALSDENFLADIEPSVGKYMAVSIIHSTEKTIVTNKEKEKKRKDKMSKMKGKSKVGILDTGMLLDHPAIEKRLISSVNLSTDNDTTDHNGHGTMMTLILLASLRYQVELYNLKVLNANRGGKTDKLIEAIEWCIKNKVDIINVSAGYFNETCSGDCNVCNAARKASESGIMVYASAGNEGYSRPYCPAKAGLWGAPLVIAGGMADEKGNIESYSGRGDSYSSFSYEFVPVYRALTNAGYDLFLAGNYDGAIDCCDEAIDIDPSYHLPWYIKSLVMTKKGRYKESIGYINESIRLFPPFDKNWTRQKLARNWITKGNIFSTQNELAEAVICYNKAIEIDPDRAGSMFVDASNFKNSPRNITPTNTNAWYSKGFALYSMGKMAEAVNCYTKALIIDPNCLDAWNSKGIALFELGDYPKSLESFDKAIQSNPADPYPLLNKGRALHRMDRSIEAIGLFDDVIRIDPDNADVWDAKGEALKKLGQTVKGQECFDTAERIRQKYVKKG
jgi:tetratricopeptide (TPR) repeat protein